MGNVISKKIEQIELFLRGEFYLHLATMFILLIFLVQTQIITTTWMGILVSLGLGVAWEFAWKWYKQKPVNLLDIIGTLSGGILAIIFIKYIPLFIVFLNK